MERRLVVIAFVVVMAGCGRIGYDDPWDQILVVDVFEDRMAAPATATEPSEVGAVGLSLREAVTIANNTPGSELVRFDPAAFDSGRTGIDLGSALTVEGSSTHIDCGGRAELRGAPLVLSGVTDVEVTGCRFSVPGDDAIRIVDSTGVYVHDNELIDSGGHGIRVESTSGTCEGVLIKSNRFEHAGNDLLAVYDCRDVFVGYNVMVVGDKGAQRGVHFERVTESFIVDNLIDPGEARMINFQDSSNNTIQGNVLEGAHAGVVLYGASNDNTIMQNVAMDMVYDGVYVSTESLRNVVVHNTFFRCATGLADGAPDTVVGNNLSSSDPADFVDPTTGVYDFTLVATSPHVDAGADLGYDCLPDQEERFWGAAPDLGAVESH